MFSWAQSTFDKLSQAVAPPPEDGVGRFSYCVQRNDEEGAMGCVATMDPVRTIANQVKGAHPIHLACQASMVRLIRLLLAQPGANLSVIDGAGNTPMHYAAMSTAPSALEALQMLVKEYGGSAIVKNGSNQTPYDVATVNSIRQYLLPIQLQAETQYALDNGGVGLPPGIDLGGLRIQNSAMPPPPMHFGTGPATTPHQTPAAHPPPQQQQPAPQPQQQSYLPQLPQAVPHQQQQAPQIYPQQHCPPQQQPLPPQQQQYSAPSLLLAPAPASAPVPPLPPAPTSGNREYARVGSSSAAIFSKPNGSIRSFVRPDGFHSSSSDVNLQKKYGHSAVNNRAAVPPPPSSGGNPVSTPSPASVGNPFAAGAALGSRYGSLPSANRRYVAYGPTTPAPPAAAVAASASPMYNYTPPAASGMAMFNPGISTSQTQTNQYQHQHQHQQQGTTFLQTPFQTNVTAASPMTQQTPGSYGAPSTPFMAPPPYQSNKYKQFGQEQVSSSQSLSTQSDNKKLWTSSGSTSFGSTGSGVIDISSTAATHGSAQTPQLSIGSIASNNNIISAGGNDYAASVFSPPVTPGANAGNLFAVSPAKQENDDQALSFSPNDFMSPLNGTPSPALRSRAESAEELFGDMAPDQSAEQETPDFGELNDPARMGSPPQVEVLIPERKRTLSAEELFAVEADEEPLAETLAAAPEPSPASTIDASGGPQSGPSITPAPEQRSVKRTMSAEELFAEISLDDGAAGTVCGEALTASIAGPGILGEHRSNNNNQSASDVSGSSPFASTEPSPDVAAATLAAASASVIPSAGDDGMMDEVPLSPGLEENKVEAAPYESQGPSQTSANDLFAAIGMPPPPFSSRKS